MQSLYTKCAFRLSIHPPPRINYLFSPKTATQRRVLDDRQLLLWLLALMVLVIVYLGVWTGVAPPYVTTWVNLDNEIEAKCSRNWWNFSILIGIVCGCVRVCVYVCVGVRTLSRYVQQGGPRTKSCMLFWCCIGGVFCLDRGL